MLNYKNNKGFTLVEIMITITVLGVISAISIPVYQNYVTRTQVAESLALFNAQRVEAENFLTLYDNNQNKFFDKTYRNGIETNYVEASNELYGADYKGDKSYQLGYLYGKQSNDPLQGKAIVFFNEITDKDNYIWNCETNIEKKYLPDGLKCVVSNPSNIQTEDPVIPTFSGNYDTRVISYDEPKKYTRLIIRDGVPVFRAGGTSIIEADEYDDPQYETVLLKVDENGNQFYAVKKNGVLDHELGITPNGSIVQMSVNPINDNLNLKVSGFNNKTGSIRVTSGHWIVEAKADSADYQLKNSLLENTSDAKYADEIMSLYESRWNFKNSTEGKEYFQNLSNQ